MENFNSKHHLTAGGFIFYEDPENSEVYVAFIKNKWGQWWLPKGHIEKNENPLQTAFREIEEEIGLKREVIEFVDFCCLDSFSFEKNGRIDTKDLYIYVFNSKRKADLVKSEDDNLHDAAWFKYEEALSLISFNKNDLIKSKEIFDKRVK